MSTSEYANLRESATSEHQFPHSNDLTPTTDFLDYLRDYARQKPEVAALWCLGIGFILGWKLKPW